MSTILLRGFILGLSCGIGLANSASSTPGPTSAPVLTEQTAGSAVRTRIGVPVEIRLRSQPGTGFSWIPKTFAANLTAMDPIRGQAIPGGWQAQRFRFVAKRAGTYRLIFSYDQPWTGGTKGTRSANFTIRVR